MEFSRLGFNPEYDDNKKEDIIYVSQKKSNLSSDNSYRCVSLIVKEDKGLLSEKNAKIEQQQRKSFPNDFKDFTSEEIDFKICDSVTLYTSPSGQQKFSCWLIEDKDKVYINGIHIARRTKKGVYSSHEVTLNFKAILALKTFLEKLPIIDNKRVESFKFPLEENKNVNNKKILTKEEFETLIKQNIVNINDIYKLSLIQKMELGIKKLEEIVSLNFKNEIEIQKILNENIWMFGNSYSFIIDETKINEANILDIIPKDLDGFVDIIEVKRPDVELFHIDSSHNNLYPSSFLTKAIAQTQNYIFEFEQKTSDNNYQNNNNCKIIKPRGIIIIGSKENLTEEENKYLRILNSSYHNIYIITYQQLLDRAKKVLEVNDLQ